MQIEELWEKIQNELGGIKTDIKELNTKTDRLEENVEKLNAKTDNLEEKMNVMANVNLAKILEQQTQMRQELNEKMDKYMLKNNLEHKQFAYQIARLESENGIVTKIG